MLLPAHPTPALQSCAHPERLITADWLSGNLGRPGLAIVESDEDVLLYDTGHIPDAVKIDYISGEQFADLTNGQIKAAEFVQDHLRESRRQEGQERHP